MLRVKTFRAITRQWILVSRRGIFAIKPCTIPIFWVTRQASIGEDGVSSALNRNSAKSQARVIRELILAVQIKEFSEKFNAGLLLKVYFAEDLKVADIRHGVGTNVLRMELEEV